MIKKVEGFLKKRMVKKLTKKGQELGNELSPDYKLMVDDIIKNNYEVSSEVKELISFYKDKVNKFCSKYNLEGIEVFNKMLGACLYQGYINYVKEKDGKVSMDVMKASNKICEYMGLSKEDSPFHISDTLSKFKNFMNSNSFTTPIRKFIYKNNIFLTLNELYTNKSHNEEKVNQIHKVYDDMDKYRYEDFLKSDFPIKVEQILNSENYCKNISIKYAFFITIVGVDNKDLNINELYQKLSISTYTLGKVEEKSKKKEDLIDLTLYSYSLNDVLDVCRVLSKGEYKYDFLFVSFIENTEKGGMMSNVVMEKYKVYEFSQMITYKDMTKYLYDNMDDTSYPSMDEFSKITPTIILSKMVSEFLEIDTTEALGKLPTIVKIVMPHLSANTLALFKTYDFCKDSAPYFKLQMMGRVLYTLSMYLLLKEKESFKKVIMDNDIEAMSKIQGNIVDFLNNGIANSDKKDIDIFDALKIYADKLDDYIKINIASFDFYNLNLYKEFASLLACTFMENIELGVDDEDDEEGE